MKVKSLKKAKSGTNVVPSGRMTLLDSLHQLGIKRPEIAKAIGCYESTLRRWEKGGELDPNGKNHLDDGCRKRLLKLAKSAYEESKKELDAKFTEHMADMVSGIKMFDPPQYPSEAVQRRFLDSLRDKRIALEHAYLMAWQQLAFGGIDYPMDGQGTTD
ncbi:hypothetical protein [Lancefieldella sp. Marseille-Q7238]|uniref:hypothetical protein n=1 Tax=Lancefieldella sp. Marseille-Q7238 TaxID=3022127 RepID=UPI0024A8F53E|nr:hypothetical protein [Lancefieldella sp. Marseille-Q7238]